MRNGSIFFGALFMALSSFFGSAHGSPAPNLPAAAVQLQADKSAKPGQLNTAVVAGGCFWCIEGVYQQLDGVKTVTSGYAGGTKETANYDAVCTGTTGHAESVKITYDPTKITYGELLRVLFTVIDPTQKDQQGPDVGHQYRSAIFYLDDDQKKVAEAYIQQLNATKIFKQKIATTVEPLKADAFYPAEAYHQNFVACHLLHPYVRQEALPKIEKVRDKFKDEVKKEDSTK